MKARALLLPPAAAAAAAAAAVTSTASVTAAELQSLREGLKNSGYFVLVRWYPDAFSWLLRLAAGGGKWAVLPGG